MTSARTLLRLVVALSSASTAGLAACGADELDCARVMAAEHCGEMVGETTPSCLLCESTAREVRHAAGGRRVAGAPSTACEIPVLYSGGGVFTVTRIITVEEPNLHGGVGTFAYGFLRLERGLTLDVTADIVVRHDLERNYSLDESLTVGETLLAFFPRPTSMSDEILESEW